MCGIAGYMAFGKARPSKAIIKKLLLGIEIRGRDATGLGWLEKHGDSHILQVWKGDISAKEFVALDDWKDWEVPRTLICHTRFATQGDEKQNNNNHPVFNKNGLGLVHNGVVNNYDELMKKHKWKMDGEVDTEVLVRLLERGWWDQVDALGEAAGSWAIAAINAAEPETLILARHNNPLELAYDEGNDILYWASTTMTLKDAIKRTKRGFPMEPRLHMSSVAGDHAMLVHQSKGLVKSQAIKVTPTTVTKNWWQQGRNSSGDFTKGREEDGGRSIASSNNHFSAARLACPQCRHLDRLGCGPCHQHREEKTDKEKEKMLANCERCKEPTPVLIRGAAGMELCPSCDGEITKIAKKAEEQAAVNVGHA